MQCNLATVFLLCLLVQCLQGALRPFNTEEHLEDTEYVLEKYQDSFSKSDGSEVNGARRLRPRRQNSPEASPSFTFYLDSHQFARVLYLGEGSKVNINFCHWSGAV